MPPEVYDKHGQPRSWDWLRERYGNVRFLDAGPIRKFALVRIDVTSGPAVLKARLLDGQGVVKQDQPVAFHWPGAPHLPPGEVKSKWRDRAVFNVTGSDGFTGFGLGPGSYIKDLEEGGPHVVWVLSPSLPSDGAAGLGMLGGTEHEGPLFLTFQIQQGQPVPPPPPDDVQEQLDALRRLLAEQQQQVKSLVAWRLAVTRHLQELP